MLVEREHRRELTGIPRTGAPDVLATPGKQTLIEAVSSPPSGEPSPGQRPAGGDARAVVPRAAAGTTPAPIAAQGAAAGAGPRSLADPFRACFGRPHAPADPGPTGGGGAQGPAALAADTSPRARPTRGLISHVGASPRTGADFETTDHGGKEDPLGDAGDRRAEEALPYRREMEAAFDADFSSVGVRTGSADELASIHAKASATGEEISFADRQPDRRTVAHELAHVMQHRRHGAGTGGISQPGDAAEREAEAVAAAVDAGQAAPAVHHPAVTRSGPPAAGGGSGTVDGDLGAPNRAVQRDKVGPEPNAAASAAGAPQPRSGPETVTAAGAADHAHEDRLPAAADGSTRAAPPPHGGAAMHDRSRAPAPVDRPPVPAPEGELGGVHAATQPVSAALEGTHHALDELSPGVPLSELDTAMRRAAQRVAASCAATHHQALGVPHASSLGRREEGVPPVAHPGAPPRRGQVTTTIEHARLVTDPHPARPDGISAGPRPSVVLRGGADPVSAAAALHDGQDQIDARLAGSHERSIADHGVSRLSAPIPRRVTPAPALEIPAVAVPAIAESPLRAVPSELRARIDERAAPALDRKLAVVTTAATADHEQATAELAALQTEHAAQATARTEAAHAQVTALRTRGRAQVDAVRGQWQARSRAEHDEFTRQAQAAHAAMHTEVQGMVRDGEQRSGAILADVESRAGARKASAEGRAASILAGAEARAAAARAPATARSIARQATNDAGDGGSAQSGNDDQAGEILRLAKLEVDAEMARARADMAALVADAGSLSDDQIRSREQAIAQRIDELKAKLDQTVRQVLGSHFPRMEQAYVGQIDSLLGDVHAGMDKAADALVSHDAQATSKAVAAASDLLTRRSKRLDATLDDVATLSSFHDGNVDSALAKFGIKTAGSKEGSDFTDDANSKNYDENLDLKQDILFEAIRVENAMRAADGKHLLSTPELSQPGAAFKALFNEGQGLTIRRSGDKGGVTPGPDTVRLGGLNLDEDDHIANAKRFQIGHEFGHAFNYDMIFSQLDTGSGTAVPYQHQYGKNQTSGPGAFDTDPIMLGDQLVAGGTGKNRYIPGGNDLNGFLSSKQDADLDAIEQAYATQGMRFSRQWAADHPNAFYGNVTTKDPQQGSPYQQDLISENGEWFADVFVNWANGTLADNAEGDAIDTWMNAHMQDWIEMGLAADQTKLPATATPKG